MTSAEGDTADSGEDGSDTGSGTDAEGTAASDGGAVLNDTLPITETTPYEYVGESGSSERTALSTYIKTSAGTLGLTAVQDAVSAARTANEQNPQYDTEGNEVGRIALSAPLTANILSVVHDGLIIVDFYDTDANGSAGIGAVDIHGNIVVEPGKIAAGNAYYDSGLVRGSSDSGLFVDKKGNTVIPGKFAEAANVSEEQLDKELMSYFPGSAMSLQLHATNFEEGTALLTVELWLNGMSIADRWYYVLEAHEGTYTGAGKVYDAATGQVTGGGSAARPGAPAQPAADQPSSWAAEQVEAAIAAGLVPDALQSKYTQPATRAEFCALAVELYETVTGTEITERAAFTDTADENVEKMAGLGVVTGVGEGRFDPDGTLTREQAATMLSRLAAAMGRPLTAQAPTFADSAAVSTWAVDAVGQMQGSGIMGGVGDNAFDPQGSYSREQSMLTMLRLYESVK